MESKTFKSLMEYVNNTEDLHQPHKQLDIESVLKFLDTAIEQLKFGSGEYEVDNHPYNVGIFSISTLRSYFELFDTYEVQYDKYHIDPDDINLPVLKFIGLIGYNIDLIFDNLDTVHMDSLYTYIMYLRQVIKDIQILQQITNSNMPSDFNLSLLIKGVDSMKDRVHKANKLYYDICAYWKDFYMIDVTYDNAGVSIVGYRFNEQLHNTPEQDIDNTIDPDDIYVVM